MGGGEGGGNLCDPLTTHRQQPLLIHDEFEMNSKEIVGMILASSDSCERTQLSTPQIRVV
jgi:hypothetical protein